MPNLEAGNMVVKELTFLAGADAAGIVVGALVPVILTSRADSVQSRLVSCAVATLYAAYQKTGKPTGGDRAMSGDVLVINAGSSSIKFSLFGPGGADGPELQMMGQVEGIGTAPHAIIRRASKEVLIDRRWPNGDGPRDHDQTMEYIVRVLSELHAGWKPAGVGHRVVHGGSLYRDPTIIDATVRANLETLIPLAPLHQPANLKGIDAAAKAFPDAMQVACFDTAFHQGHPWVADTYALPRDLYEQGIRRYGFHGLSYAYIARAMRQESRPRSPGGG